MQAVSDGQLGGDLGDRKSCCLRRERTRPADARIHLDDDHVTVLGIDRELNVRAARLDTDLANHRQTRVAHPLVLFVRQRLSRRNGDRIAGVNAHRIEVLDRADDHDIIIHVAHHLHLVLFPTDHRLFDQHFGHR